MSDARALLCETADRLFDQTTVGPEEVEAAGLPLLMVPEADGGFGGDWGDAFEVFRRAGRYLVEVPVAQAVIAAAASAQAGLPEPTGLQGVAMGVDGRMDATRFTGRLTGVVGGAGIEQLVFELNGGLRRVRCADAVEVVTRRSLDGGQIADLTFCRAQVETAGTVALEPLDGFATVASLVGALEAALEMSIAYANDRSQFGRPIAKFQAVQQDLAVFAEEVAAVSAAGQAAAAALDRGEADWELTAARIVASRGAEAGARTAHQIHGAIGFTQEHPLHRYTRRLVAGRSRLGPSSVWAQRLGQAVARTGADGLWPELTRRSD